ncbi:unnamed protein product [Protopolystoma xenopodis]|uniref:Uncharacterized protein n=1 Tax=Protopolystoma xenopodis TaxID=117903 RepID=A0A448WA40_9PLAT|nr:unnamed protein product [Protopolystoma xenopodis]
MAAAAAAVAEANTSGDYSDLYSQTAEHDADHQSSKPPALPAIEASIAPTLVGQSTENRYDVHQVRSPSPMDEEVEGPDEHGFSGVKEEGEANLGEDDMADDSD